MDILTFFLLSVRPRHVATSVCVVRGCLLFRRPLPPPASGEIQEGQQADAKKAAHHRTRSRPAMSVHSCPSFRAAENHPLSNRHARGERPSTNSADKNDAHAGMPAAPGCPDRQPSAAACLRAIQRSGRRNGEALSLLYCSALARQRLFLLKSAARPPAEE
jgi:hypothetical protein